MQDYKIERVGQPDLEFTGELIGKSSGEKPRVIIYRTTAGEFIGQVAETSQRSEAGHFAKPELLVNWLKYRLTSITEEAQAAIEDAALHDEAFKSFWTERVA
jgi:hypothetical protein